MVIDKRKSPREVADKIEVRTSVLNDWLVEPLIAELENAKIEITQLKKTLDKTADERVRSLQKENQVLREQVETLKKTVAILSVQKSV